MHDLYHQRRYLIPFRSQLLPHVFTDTLVIGAGVAGMRAAIEAARGSDVILLAKGPLDQSNTAWAQGGIAFAAHADDSIDAHISDTLEAGSGLCDEAIVRTMVEEGPARLAELIDWGMRFDSDRDGDPLFGREGGHRVRRILHTDGAATGRELVRCLGEHVTASPNIRVFDSCFALDLLTDPYADDRGGRVLGAITHHPRFGLQIIWANAVVLATGGAGQVYRETSNPRGATGDGVAMAWRAGAELSDLEFMQFHPTTLYVAGASRSLISEAVRGEGALLVDRDGHRFMVDRHDMAELAPRDIVSRAIMDQIARTREASVSLDVRHLPAGEFKNRFPNLTELLTSFDIDPERDLIPVHPAAHYSIGGVRVDARGRTSVPGLLACGEAAANGAHGANRLASNSLLDGLVFGRRAGLEAVSGDESGNPRPVNIVSDIHSREHGELDLVDVRSSLRSVMWRNVGIERTGPKLTDVVDMFDFWGRYMLETIFDEPSGWETQNLLTCGALMTRAALFREESRGTHWRSDFANADEAWRIHVCWRADEMSPICENPVTQANAIEA